MGNEAGGSSSKETVPNKNLSPQVAFLTQINSQLSDKCASHERSNEDMRSQLATLTTKNKELSDVNLQLVKLKKTYNELAREKSSLDSDNVDLRQLNDFLLEQCVLHKRSDEDVKSQLQTLRQTNCILESEKVSLNRANAHLRQEKDTLHDKCVSYERSDKEVKSQLLTLKQRNVILESEKISLNKDNTRLRQEKDTLHDKCVSYERFAEDMKAQIATSLSRNKKLAAANLHLKGSGDKLSEECTELKTCNENLNSQLAILNDDNTNLMRVRNEVSEKCADLEKRNEKLDSELSDYESWQVLGQMLDLRGSLQEIRKDIDEIEGDDSLSEETEKLKGQISKKKDENRKLEDELQRKSQELTNHYRPRQLIRAEIELETTRKDVCNFLTCRRQYLSSITENIQKYTEEFDSISTSVGKIESKLKNYSEKLVKLQDEGEDLKKQQQKECETILALLDKQNDAIKVLMTLSDADRNQSDVKRYAIQILNLKESNAYEDCRTVVDIINYIHEIPEEDIEVRRVGDSHNSTRPIMVYLPSFMHISKILSARWKLKNSKYHYIQIAPGKKREETGEETPPQKTSATFSYELA